ncbi:response regulator [Nibricoccus sp. IMCC34717]|uniref:hybrid sensor histidine kinase/response regulator n=1 Tax=Nibricoccus sp. IMCC34717 TaxID=3034021 RepID=UPI00384D2992
MAWITPLAWAGLGACVTYFICRFSGSVLLRRAEKGATAVHTNDVEEELKSVLEATPSAIVRINHESKITLVNTLAENMFGYTREEMLGQPIEVLLPDRIRAIHPRFVEQYMQHPEPRSLGGNRELFARRKSGAEFQVEIGLNPIHTSRGLSVIASIIDISERKSAEARQRDFESKLQETQKLESLGVLAGGIAHDFNNLLTGILGNANLVAEMLPVSSPAIPLVDDIEKAAARAGDLCRQLLAYAGKGRFVVRSIDLNQIIEETTHLISISISKTCVLRFNLTAKLPAVLADPTQVRQVIMNLVINASEAIGDRSGVIAITTGVVRVDSAYLGTLYRGEEVKQGDYVTLEVSDNGCGMDTTTLSRIFDPFFTTKFTGRGLGLAAVMGIIRSHQGALKVYSEPGKGTTFKILLPIATDSSATNYTQPSFPSSIWRGSGRILVADDEETVRTVAARILERHGFEVELVCDGTQAIHQYRTDPSRYRLVILDLTMPHTDGEETFRQLRHLNPGVRVILMSGFNQQEAVSRFTGKGLAGFVQKPFEVDSLVNEIKRVLLTA